MSAISLGSWSRLRALLERALELDEPARTAYVQSLEGDDAALRAELERLLDEHTRLVDRPAPNALEIATPFLNDEIKREIDRDNERIGRQIGAYKLVRVLGTGGMGAVYLAERSTEGFAQQVALKLVREAFGSASARERFERERQILARLRHPGIASLFDGGTTSDAQPFYTMEYVDGDLVTDYCYGRVDTATARVEVLLQIASALSYAHQHLIVHRDIKPSNVLVDAAGQIKLVDFGLAKLLDQRAGAMMTQAGTMPMTPAYAAPEQFRNEAVTVATDIYQFGALAFVLLAGALPYRGDPEDRLAWSRAVTEDEPLTLARAFEGSDLARLDAIAARRYRRQLTRDLDAILRKALAKTPSGRYGSMDALMADLRAFRAGAPVTARRAGPAYFAWRFVLRHRYAVGLSAAAVLALAITTIVAVRQERIATGEADRSRAAANFVGALFDVGNPGSADDQAGATTRTGPRSTRFSIELGDLTQARTLLEKASAFLAKNEKPNLGYANAEEKLGEIDRMDGNFKEAFRHYDNAERTARAVLGEHHYFLTWPIHDKALAELDQRHYEAALAGFDRALALLHETLPGTPLEGAMSLDGRAQALLGLKRYPEAKADAEAALAVVREKAPKDHPMLVFALLHVGLARHALGDPAGAKSAWDEALMLGSRAFAADAWRLERIRDAIAHPDLALTDPVPVASYY
jgi:serine/threonine-protein kinase